MNTTALLSALIIVNLLFLLSCTKKETTVVVPPSRSFRLAIQGSCSPQTVFSSSSEAECLALARLLNTPLTKTKQEGNQWETLPALAQSWTQEKPGRLKILLNKEMKWSNGAPLHARHFIAKWKKLLLSTPQSDSASLLFPIKNARAISRQQLPVEELGAKAVDAHTLVLDLVETNENFIRQLSHPALGPEFGTHPPQVFPTLGPYLLKSYSKHLGWVLVPNPLFPHSKPPLKEIKVGFHQPELHQKNAYLDGNLDFLVLRNLKGQKDESIPGERLLFPSPYSYVLVLNPRKRVFSTREGRKNSLLALQREETGTLLKWDHRTIDRIYTGEVLTSAPWLAKTDAATLKKLSEKVLAQTKFYREHSPLSLLYPPTVEGLELAENIRAQWTKNLGLPVELNALSFVSATSIDHDFTAAIVPLRSQSSLDLSPLKLLWDRYVFKNLVQYSEYLPYEASLLPWISPLKQNVVSFEEWLVGKEFLALPLVNLSISVYLAPPFKGLTLDHSYLWNFEDLEVN